MNKRLGYSAEVRERALRLVLSSEHEHTSRWAATQSVAYKLTLRSQVKKVKID